jgi:uncharacterized protein
MVNLFGIHRKIAVSLWAVALLATSDHAVAQNWSYRGSSICYDFGAGSTQCYASGTIQEAVSNRDEFNAQFQAGWAAGEGIGNLVNGLLGVWAQHRARIQAERSDLRTQLQTYQTAISDLLEELVRQQQTLVAIWPRWVKYTQQERDAESQIEQFARWASQFERTKTESEKNTSVIAGAKDLKFLRQSVEVQKRFHDTLYKQASQGYVFTEIASAVVGYYESPGAADAGQPAPQTALARVASGPQSLLERAEAGDVKAQSELGVRYMVGEGLPRNYAEAARWLREAADQGDLESQLDLGRLYLDGHGVLQDYVAAHVMFNLAASAGFPKAQELRDMVAAKMTPAQIAEAQKLAREWKPKSKHQTVTEQ